MGQPAGTGRPAFLRPTDDPLSRTSSTSRCARFPAAQHSKEEQGVDFAVVAVKSHVLAKANRAKDDLVRAYSLELGVPAVLMAQDARGRATYYGRRDLVDFLSHLLVEQLPWREFTIRAA